MVLNESMPVSSEQLPINPNNDHLLEIPAPPSAGEDIARRNRRRRMLLLRERRTSVRHRQHIVEMQHQRLNRTLQHTNQRREQRSRQTEEEKQEIREQHTQQQQRHRVELRERPPTFRMARIPIVDEREVQQHLCGRRSYICPQCHALKWDAEKTLYSLCCNSGRNCNILQLFPRPYPQPLKDLLLNDTSHHIPRELIGHFQKHIRHINSALQFASSSATFVRPAGGESLISIHGAIHHRVGSLLPESGQRHTFMQMYLIDDENEQVDCRIHNVTDEMSGDQLNRALLLSLQTMLHSCNPFVHHFKQIVEMIEDHEIAQYELHIHTDGRMDHRRYNRPTGDGVHEVAALLPGNEQDTNISDSRSIQIRLRGGPLQYISDCHKSYDAFHFVLFHPEGQDGWSPASIELIQPSQPHHNLHESHQGNEEEHPRRAEDNNEYFDEEPAEEHIEHSNEHTVMEETRRVQQKYVTLRQYASFIMHNRTPEINALMVYGKRLYQEYLCDKYATIEGQRLSWNFRNQHILRSDLYQGITDAFHNGERNTSNLGRRIILPSSFTGGPRQMNQLYQDAMAIVRSKGTPNAFITITCDSHWPEIQSELKPGEKAEDRPDLIARVFRMKLKAIMDYIIVSKIFGTVVAHIHTIEFQKRGLPHAHALFILSSEDKPRSPNDIDEFVCAEIPDPDTHPILYDLVTKHMLHGPCGNANLKCSCIVDDKCRFRFPREFSEHTTLPNDKEVYPHYRRPNNGRTYTKPTNPNEGFVYDNRWVVPYNALLLLMFRCHINVEICSNVTAVKYLYKYIYKGPDRAIISTTPSTGTTENEHDEEANLNEVRMYQSGRYIGSSEAAWRLYSFPLHEEFPHVQRLQIHLPGHERIHFRQGSEVAELMDHPPITTLTGWFAFNKRKKTEHERNLLNDPSAEPHICLKTLYHNFPSIATWNAQAKTWHDRSAASQHTAPIGRMYFVQPNDVERYHLRLLLLNTPGATSFNDLKTTIDPNGLLPDVEHETFLQACVARGLCQNDQEWFTCMSEACTFGFPMKLRELFVNILLFNDVAEPMTLWNSFKDQMSEDYLYRARQMTNNANRQLDDEIFFQTLRAIDKLLLTNPHPRTLLDFGLPVPPALLPYEGNLLVDDERARYDLEEQATLTQQYTSTLNAEQRHAYDIILHSVTTMKEFMDEQEVYQQQTSNVAHPGNTAAHHYEDNFPSVPTCFFIDGLGGAGKTFLYNTLLSKIRSTRGGIAIAVAGSGIAALLLEGGRTAHSRFQIPINDLDSNSTCFITKQSKEAQLILASNLIIWDEAPMHNKSTFEAVHKTLQDLTGINKAFGGKVIVMGGDFRQVLPIIPHGNRAEIVSSALNQASFWPHVSILKLHLNMRVQLLHDSGDIEAANRQASFASWLQRIGEGTEKNYPVHGENMIRIPDELCIGCKENEHIATLIQKVYGEIHSIQTTSDRTNYIVERAIVTPLNKDVDMINEYIGKTYFKNEDGSPVTMHTYLSADEALQGEEDEQTRHGPIYPIEFLNSLNLSGIPPHRLEVFVGCPIILLKNMSGGLANGTRLIITKMMSKVIEAKITTGPSKDQRVCIPRINMIPSNVERMPFTLRRRQFPIRPAFAMTINKSQGQTFKKIGVYLPNPVFSHGQLYVAFSRVGTPNGLHIMVPNGWKCQKNHQTLGEAPAGVYTKNIVFQDVF